MFVRSFTLASVLDSLEALLLLVSDFKSSSTANNIFFRVPIFVIPICVNSCSEKKKINMLENVENL